MVSLCICCGYSYSHIACMLRFAASRAVRCGVCPRALQTTRLAVQSAGQAEYGDNDPHGLDSPYCGAGDWSGQHKEIQLIAQSGQG
jgi:hypothetical protein